MAEHGQRFERWLQHEGEELLYAPDDIQAQNIMAAAAQGFAVEPPLADDANPFFMLDVVQRQQAIINEYQQRCQGQWMATSNAAGEEPSHG